MLVAERTRKPTRPPDYDWLTRRINYYAHRDRMYVKGRISYNQVGERIGRDTAIYGLVNRKYEPSARTLELLADWAGESRDIWLRRGGYGDPPRPEEEPAIPGDDPQLDRIVAWVHQYAPTPEAKEALYADLQATRRRRADAAAVEASANGVG